MVALQVVRFHAIFDDVNAVVVRLAVGDAALDSAAGEPDGKAVADDDRGRSFPS